MAAGLRDDPYAQIFNRSEGLADLLLCVLPPRHTQSLPSCSKCGTPNPGERTFRESQQHRHSSPEVERQRAAEIGSDRCT